MSQIALITGASSGLGVDFARQLSAKGYHCILTARREDKLKQVQSELSASGGSAEIYVADLSNYEACTRLSTYVIETYPQIEVVINNAGFGAYGSFESIDLGVQLDMIEVNCKALLALTYTLGKHMLHMKTEGYILNVASTAAFQPGPTMATYFASKAFVLSLSEAIQFEWKDSGVHIATLCPGATKTEFFDHSNVADSSQMVQNMMSSHKVVQYGLDGLFAKKRVIITGCMNNMLYYLGLLMPNRVVMGIIKKIMAK